MTRRFILFLALLLPLQFAWASAASYCQHEASPAKIRHFGHHEHLHKAGIERPLTRKLAADNDCGTCQAAGSSVISDSFVSGPVIRLTAAIVPHASRRVPTALSRAPDRPRC